MASLAELAAGASATDAPVPTSTFTSTFTSTSTSTSIGSSAAASDEAAALEKECTATFEAVIKLEEVETKTGTEEESVIYTQRAKLFIFGETMLDVGTGNKTWRERGVGSVQLLKHNEFGKIRILMRQEKTLKIIVNHVIDPRIVLEPNSGSDRSWVWSAFDFADGEELKETIFAMRFGNSEKAEEFKVEFLAAQKVMEAEMGGADGGSQEAGDELAGALEGAKVEGGAEEEVEAEAEAEAEKPKEEAPAATE